MEGKEKRSGPLLNPPNPNLPYREDCWSEGATSTLIEAWGERYVELNRGNLRQKHWQEVADAVNSRRTAVKRPPRTDVQCKNRIDTLKKKYKVEKTRMSQSHGGYRSPWQFFPRLDELVGPAGLPSAPGAPGQQGKKQQPQQQQQLLAYYSSPSPPPAPAAHQLPYHRKHPTFHSHASAAAAAAMADARNSKRPKLLLKDPYLRKGSYSAAAAAAAASKAEDDAGMESESSPERAAGGRGRGMVYSVGGGGGGDGGNDAESDREDGVMELARAIEKFGEVYEKVEMAKHRQMIELEKQRMEFARDIEFQRMDMFINSLLQMQKGNRTTNRQAGE